MSNLIHIERHRYFDAISMAYAHALINERKITGEGEDFDQAVCEGVEYAEEEIKLHDLFVEVKACHARENRSAFKKFIDKIFGMKTPTKILIAIVALALVLLYFTSCTQPEDVTPIDTRNEGHTAVSPPPDFAYHPPADNVSLPDMCTEYATFNDPFITGVIQFDIAPDTLVWYYRNDPIDLAAYFPDHALYLSGINVSLIVFGTNNHTQWQQKIWTYDGSGAKNYFSFGRDLHPRQHFNFLGALTYDEMLDLFPQILSARYFGFYNSGLDCAQFQSLIQILQDNCVDGTGKTMQLKFAPCQPTPDQLEYLNSSDWTIIF